MPDVEGVEVVIVHLAEHQAALGFLRTADLPRFHAHVEIPHRADAGTGLRKQAVLRLNLPPVLAVLNRPCLDQAIGVAVLHVPVRAERIAHQKLHVGRDQTRIGMDTQFVIGPARQSGIPGRDGRRQLRCSRSTKFERIKLEGSWRPCADLSQKSYFPKEKAAVLGFGHQLVVDEESEIRSLSPDCQFVLLVRPDRGRIGPIDQSLPLAMGQRKHPKASVIPDSERV